MVDVLILLLDNYFVPVGRTMRIVGAIMLRAGFGLVLSEIGFFFVLNFGLIYHVEHALQKVLPVAVVELLLGNYQLYVDQSQPSRGLG